MPYESLTEISEKTWDLVVDVDMKGVFLCLKYELLQMQKQGFGTIVNAASIGGYKMAPGFAAYGPAKAAVIALTEMAALENAPFVQVQPWEQNLPKIHFQLILMKKQC